MVERIEDLNLPNAVVNRLMKEAIPDGVAISKEAKSALTRAASVFVLYLTTTATNIASKKKVKTLAPAHVFGALEEIEFESFVEPLQAFLETYQANQKEKRESKGAVKTDATKKDKPDEAADHDSDVEIVPVDD